DRGQPARLPADVAGGVGVELVLGRRAPAVHRGQELVPVGRPHVVHAPQVRGHARLQPGGADGEGGVPLGVLVDDRAVAGVVQLDLDVAAALDLDGVVHHLHRLPAALVPVLERLAGGCVVGGTVLSV